VIDIAKLTQEDVGRWVTYTDGSGSTERGKIKSWNDSGVFVVYNANDNWDGDHWKDYTAAHTRPEDLEFVG
jgi:hypothetical protein